MANYVSMSSQPSRLGSFEGVNSSGLAVIGAISNTVISVTKLLEENRTQRSVSRDQRHVLMTQAQEITKRLGIETEGSVQQAAIGVKSVEVKYSSLSKFLLAVGLTLGGLLLSSAFAYKLALKEE